MSSAGAAAWTIDDAIDRIGFGRFQEHLLAHETKDADLADTLGEPNETDKPRFSGGTSQRERQLVG